MNYNTVTLFLCLLALPFYGCNQVSPPDNTAALSAHSSSSALNLPASSTEPISYSAIHDNLPLDTVFSVKDTLNVLKHDTLLRHFLFINHTCSVYTDLSGSGSPKSQSFWLPATDTLAYLKTDSGFIIGNPGEIKNPKAYNYYSNNDDSLSDIYSQWQQSADMEILFYHAKLDFHAEAIFRDQTFDLKCPADRYVFKGSTAQKINCTTVTIPYMGKTLLYEEGFSKIAWITRSTYNGKTCVNPSLPVPGSEAACALHSQTCEISEFAKKTVCDAFGIKEYCAFCLNADPSECR